MSYIQVENLSFYYDDEPVLENVSYHVDPGEFVILTGENGAAKSTLIKATLGLLKPSSGQVTIAKQNTAGVNYRWGTFPSRLLPLMLAFPAQCWNWSTQGAILRGNGSKN